jgi:S1-C subfamily serine protease
LRVPPLRRYYQILGIAPTASPQEIKEAWLFSLKAFHPDKFADAPRHQQAVAEARTQAINEAYKVLSDPVSRSVYDRDYFREASYAKSDTKPTANTAPLQHPQPPSKQPVSKQLFSSLLPIVRWRWVAVVGVAAATLLIFVVFKNVNSKKNSSPQEPAFTQIVVPSFVPPPTPLPLAPAHTPDASPPASFDLPRLASFARKAVGLVMTFDANGKPLGTGSGFFISDEGRFVTNEHVIRGAKRTTIKMENGAFYQVKEVSIASSQLDLAILQVRGNDMPFLKFETSGLPEVGTRIAVIGSPVALEGTLSDGIVSAIRKEDDGTWIQITAPISPGSSGSPVLNGLGRVLGVVTLASTGRIQNLNFARSVFDLIALDPKLSDRSKMLTSITRTDAVETPRPASPTPAPSSAASSSPTLRLAQSPTPPHISAPSPIPSSTAPRAILAPTPGTILQPEPASPIPVGSPTPVSPTVTPSRTYRVVGLPKSVPFLNIRSGPGAHFAVVGIFTPKGRGIVLGPGRLANSPTIWQEIFSGDFHGWVNAQYLEEEKSAQPAETKTTADTHPSAGPEKFVAKTPSPRGDRSLDAWIGEFVRSFVASTEGDLDLSSSFYAGTVEMFEEGRKSIEAVRSDIEKYNKRWPVRRTSVAGPVRVKETEPNHSYDAAFNQDYYVEDSTRGEWINGTVAVDLQIEIDSGGIPRIISMKQKTLRRDKGNIQRLRH